MTDAVEIELIKAVPALVTAVGVLVSVILTWRNGRKTDSVHDSLNSRLTEWKNEEASKILAAHALGRQEERDAKVEPNVWRDEDGRSR
jgi:hypothetical protein